MQKSTHSTFSPAKSKTCVMLILLGSAGSFFSDAAEGFSTASSAFFGIESKMELTILRGVDDDDAVFVDFDFAAVEEEEDMEARLPRPDPAGFLGFADVSFLKSEQMAMA